MSVQGDEARTCDVLGLLTGARQARSDPAAAERAIKKALAAAPDDFTARLAAYKFYFYNHRLAEALPHAGFIVRLAARRLNVAPDWRAVRPGDAAFDEMDEAPGVYLQALLAWGYCNARLGVCDEGALAIAKVADLDPGDRFGARRLLKVVETGRAPEEE